MMQNPFVLDAKNSKWSRIPIDKNLISLFDVYGSSYFKENGAIRTSVKEKRLIYNKEESLNSDSYVRYEGYAKSDSSSINRIHGFEAKSNTNIKKPERAAVYMLENYDYNLHENQTDATKIILELQKGGYNEKQTGTILQNYTSVYGTIFKRYNSKSRRFVKLTRESASIRENYRKESARTGTLGVIGEEFSDSGVKLYQARPEC